MTYQEIIKLQAPCKRKIWTDRFCFFNAFGSMQIAIYDSYNTRYYGYSQYPFVEDYGDKTANDWTTELSQKEHRALEIMMMDEAIRLAQIQHQQNQIPVGTILVFVVFLIILLIWII